MASNSGQRHERSQLVPHLQTPLAPNSTDLAPSFSNPSTCLLFSDSAGLFWLPFFWIISVISGLFFLLAVLSFLQPKDSIFFLCHCYSLMSFFSFIVFFKLRRNILSVKQPIVYKAVKKKLNLPRSRPQTLLPNACFS